MIVKFFMYWRQITNDAAQIEERGMLDNRENNSEIWKQAAIMKLQCP